MSLSPLPETTDHKGILARVNQRLSPELKIQSDDPVLSLVALNDELLKVYLETLQNALKEAEAGIETSSRQAMDETRDLVGRMIDRTGDHLKEQLIQTGIAWEEKFKVAAAQELAAVQNAGFAAKIGGYAILLAGCLALLQQLFKLFS